MRAIVDWVKNNKKIIVTVALIIILLIILYFINVGSQTRTAATVYTQEKSATEQKLTGILSNIEGVGTTDVMINESQGTITGVVIVSSGADNIMTRNNILNAVSTALNIDKKIIAIYPDQFDLEFLEEVYSSLEEER